MVIYQLVFEYPEPASPDMDLRAAAFALAADLQAILRGEVCPVHVGTTLDRLDGSCEVCDLEEAFGRAR